MEIILFIRCCITRKYYQTIREDIAALLNQKVDADMSRILGDLNNAYNSRANALESQISAQQVKMRSAADNCREKFTFNDTDIIKEIEETIKNKEADRKKQQATLDTYRIKNGNYKLSYTSLLDKLSEVSERLVEDVLDCNRTGNEYILKTKFLIHEVSGKPIFWDFPMTSCLFVHDCEHDDIFPNFIKLIAIQILNTMNPFAFEINYWDTKELGMDMMVFDSLSTANLFNIKTDEKDIKDSITDLMAILKKRSVKYIERVCEYNSIQ